MVVIKRASASWLACRFGAAISYMRINVCVFPGSGHNVAKECSFMIQWLSLFYGRGQSLGEQDVEESGEILNILLQPYAGDGDPPGTKGGGRPCV